MLSVPKENLGKAQSIVWFFESLDRINRAIQESSDLEQMLMKVLDTMLEIYDSDRAWMCYPCDPTAATWRVPLERTKPEWPGGFALKCDFPMTPDVARVQTAMLAAAGKPILFGPGHPGKLPDSISEKFSIKSFICSALFPKDGKPWSIGMHQCSRARFWTQDEQCLFEEIGRRVSDGLTSLLVHRNLLKSEERYRYFVETAAEGVVALDANGAISFSNQKMADMLGYTVEELVGRNALDFVHPEELSNHQERLARRKEGVPESFERRLIRKDGQSIWVLISGSPIFGENVSPNGSFGMVADISVLKEAERQLIEAKEAAEHAARMKSRFLDIAAHELRTPVAALSMAVELAQADAEIGGPLNSDLLERMQRQTTRLNRLVVDLLDGSRLDRGSIKLEREEVALTALIDECLVDCKTHSKKRFITVRKPLEPIMIRLDKVRIQQVVLNLLDNANKYTPEHAPIEIEISSLSDRVRVWIHDHGPGIPFELQAQLFKPFHRGSSDLEVRSAGLGLGLAVCEGIVKLHGGSIGFCSDVGAGSTFFFDLPKGG